METKKTSRTWHFARLAGTIQPILETGEDLATLAELDQKFWSVLSAPVKGVWFDADTLRLLDANGDGRIRAPEIIETVSWLNQRLSTLDPIVQPAADFPLSALREDTPEGKALLESARRLLTAGGQTGTDHFSEADLDAGITATTNGLFNGDGVIVAAALPESARGLLDLVIDAGGSVKDASGADGANEEQINAVLSAADTWLSWQQAGADFRKTDRGMSAVEALAAVNAVREKVADYFERLDLQSFSSSLPFPKLTAESVPSVVLESLPLAHPTESGALPLTDTARINPAWTARMADLKKAVAAVLNETPDELTREAWERLTAAVAPVAAWLAAKPQVPDAVSSIAPEALSALASPENRKALTDAVAADSALVDDRTIQGEWKKLFTLYRHFAAYLRSYINLSDLYSPEAMPTFRLGTLYMDGRACHLCFHVEGDAAAHAAQAAAGKACLGYCKLVRQATGETRTICAVFTAGRADTLQVGRNGLFYDRNGDDWDATLTQLVDHPISLREAFWSPWRKIALMIGTQIQKLLSSREDAIMAQASKSVDTNVTLTPPPAPPAEPPANNQLSGAAMASSVAVIGIAIGAIGSAVGSLISLFTTLPVWKTVGGVFLIILAVSLPSVLLTWIKLRARNLAPILNASGWAMNQPVKMTLRLGKMLTTESNPPRPRRRHDPFADSRTGLMVGIGIVVIAVLVGLVVTMIFAQGSKVTNQEVPAVSQGPVALPMTQPETPVTP